MKFKLCDGLLPIAEISFTKDRDSFTVVGSDLASLKPGTELRISHGFAECYMPPDEYQRLLALGANYEATVEQCKYLQAENDKLHKQLSDARADRAILQNDLNAALEFCVCPAAHGRKDPGSCGPGLSSEQRAALTAEVEKANIAPRPDPPPGYMILPDGETIRDGDLLWSQGVCPTGSWGRDHCCTGEQAVFGVWARATDEKRARADRLEASGSWIMGARDDWKPERVEVGMQLQDFDGDGL